MVLGGSVLEKLSPVGGGELIHEEELVVICDVVRK